MEGPLVTSSGPTAPVVASLIPGVLAFPDIDPVMVRVGPVAIRWYGLAYLVGLAAALLLLRRDARRRGIQLTGEDALEAIVWLAAGLFVGARLGYVLAYDPGYFLSHPAAIPAVWTGGMSFHGGLVGALAGGGLWALRRRKAFYPLADILVAAAPIGLGLGRLANFVNGELWGRPSTLPWAMVFPGAGPAPRHPSQLYEAFLEGLLLFALMRVVLSLGKPEGVPFWTFIASYGALRFLVEFTRQPDPQIGLVAGILSMGQLLSVPTIVLGAWLALRRARPARPPENGAA